MYLRDPEELRRRIDQRGLTIREVAALAAPMSAGFISHLLVPRGEPGARPRKRSCSPEAAQRIARALRCHVNDLFDERRDALEDSDDDAGSFPVPGATITGSGTNHRRSA